MIIQQFRIILNYNTLCSKLPKPHGIKDRLNRLVLTNGKVGCCELLDHMEYCVGLVVAFITCDQRSAFSENTTGTILVI